jgi:predicted ATPase/class 3 adenylate cyclase
MAEYPSGTVAFLFTDVEGSTRRWESHQAAMHSAVERHFALLRDAVAAQRGVVYKTIGDAVQAAFPTAADAVCAAVAAQAALARANWGDLGPFRVRMAIHVGEATPRDGDYLAPALNRLARVLATGYGGQILLTEAARALVATEVPAAHALRDLGAHRLKDLLVAEHIFQLTGPGLDVDFPPLRSLERRPHNLPAQPTPLLGRETEVAALREALAAPSPRLVTLTGPGGVGKTRLALQAAAEAIDSFPDGVWWAPLAGVSDPALLPDAIAAPLGVREAPGEALLDSIGAHLRARHALLLLDNLEHLPDAGAPIAHLLAAAPDLRVLATSRAPLHVRGERTFPVAPLPLPRPARDLSLEDALSSPAVQLFVDRAQAVVPDFQLDAATAPAVAAICQRLDGLPLAIELAAARTRLLPPPALLARLERALPLLTGGARDLPERQRTLRATIAWSHDLLAPEEQRLFAQLSVFAGGCSLEAALAVCAEQDGDDLLLLDQLDTLVAQSLLRTSPSDGANPRFAMLETIREFGRERLQASGEADAVCQRFAAYFLSLAERAEPLLSGPEQGDWLARLTAEHDNLRESLVAAAHLEPPADHLRLAGALWRFWWVRGHLTEGRQRLDEALARRGEGEITPEVLARALDGAGVLAEAQGDIDRAAALHDEALTLWRLAEDSAGEARSLENLGIIELFDRANLTRARELHEAALACFRAADDRFGVASALANLGAVALRAEDFPRASSLYQEALALALSLGDARAAAAASTNLASLAFFQGDFDNSAALFEEALRHWQALDDVPGAALALGNLAAALQWTGDTSRAKTLYEESLALHQDLGDRQGIAFAWSHLGRVARDEGNPREAARLTLAAARLAGDIGDMFNEAESLDGLAAALLDLERPDASVTLFAAADAMRKTAGLSPPSVERSARERDLDRTRVELGAAQFEDRYQEGTRLTQAELDRFITQVEATLALQPKPESSGAPSSRQPYAVTANHE